MATNQEISSDLPIPPGEYLEEVIEDLGMTKDELAKRMNRPATKLSAVFKGDKAITPNTALQLEKVVGVPAHVWTGLEAEYRLALARSHQDEEQKRLKEEIHLVKDFRYADLAKLGVVAKKTQSTEKVMELERFFGVALVLCPHLPGTYAHGATFWLGKDKAVVMMTLRYKWADVFWFSLFHELGHILLHSRQAVIP